MSNRYKKQQGAVLVIVLIIAFVVMITLGAASYKNREDASIATSIVSNLKEELASDVYLNSYLGENANIQAKSETINGKEYDISFKNVNYHNYAFESDEAYKQAPIPLVEYDILFQVSNKSDNNLLLSKDILFNSQQIRNTYSNRDNEYIPLNVPYITIANLDDGQKAYMLDDGLMLDNYVGYVGTFKFISPTSLQFKDKNGHDLNINLPNDIQSIKDVAVGWDLKDGHWRVLLALSVETTAGKYKIYGLTTTLANLLSNKPKAKNELGVEYTILENSDNQAEAMVWLNKPAPSLYFEHLTGSSVEEHEEDEYEEVDESRVIRIVGTGVKDVVYLTDNGDQWQISVEHWKNGGVFRSYLNVYNKSDYDSIYIDTGGDQDQINVAAATIPTTLIGGSGDDQIQGGASVDIIIGGTGDDQINGNDGDDILNGGAGDDQINPGYGDDTLIGGTGTDQLNPGFEFSDYTVDTRNTVVQDGTNNILAGETTHSGDMFGLSNAFALSQEGNYRWICDTKENKSIKVGGWYVNVWLSLEQNRYNMGKCDEKIEDNKTTICHIPSGNPSNAYTITVGTSVLQAHLEHGDFIGSCEANQDKLDAIIEAHEQEENAQEDNTENSENESSVRVHAIYKSAYDSQASTKFSVPENVGNYEDESDSHFTLVKDNGDVLSSNTIVVSATANKKLQTSDNVDYLLLAAESKAIIAKDNTTNYLITYSGNTFSLYNYTIPIDDLAPILTFVKSRIVSEDIKAIDVKFGYIFILTQSNVYAFDTSLTSKGKVDISGSDKAQILFDETEGDVYAIADGLECNYDENCNSGQRKYFNKEKMNDDDYGQVYAIPGVKGNVKKGIYYIRDTGVQ